MQTITSNDINQINSALFSLRDELSNQKKITKQEIQNITNTVSNTVVRVEADLSGVATKEELNKEIEDRENAIQSIEEHYVPNTLKGEVNGVATLDENGRIPYSQLPESAMEYKGNWNATTNTPTLTPNVGINGDFYNVSEGGTFDGVVYYEGDRIIFDGSINKWSKLSGSVVLENAIGVLAIEHGGTGGTNANEAFNNITSNIQEADTDLTDNSLIITKDTSYNKRTGLKVWNYIKGKISSVLGLTETTYNGTALKATNDGNGNNISSTYALKDEAGGGEEEYITQNFTTALKIDYSVLANQSNTYNEVLIPYKNNNVNYQASVRIFKAGTATPTVYCVISSYNTSTVPTSNSSTSNIKYYVDTQEKAIYLWSEYSSSNYYTAFYPQSFLKPTVANKPESGSSATMYTPVAYSSYVSNNTNYPEVARYTNTIINGGNYIYSFNCRYLPSSDETFLVYISSNLTLPSSYTNYYFQFSNGSSTLSNKTIYIDGVVSKASDSLKKGFHWCYYDGTKVWITSNSSLYSSGFWTGTGTGGGSNIQWTSSQTKTLMTRNYNLALKSNLSVNIEVPIYSISTTANNLILNVKLTDSDGVSTTKQACTSAYVSGSLGGCVSFDNVPPGATKIELIGTGNGGSKVITIGGYDSFSMCINYVPCI